TGQMFGRRQDSLPRAVVAGWRQRSHADAARNETHAGIHLQSFLRHRVARERNHQPDGAVLAHVILLAFLAQRALLYAMRLIAPASHRPPSSAEVGFIRLRPAYEWPNLGKPKFGCESGDPQPPPLEYGSPQRGPRDASVAGCPSRGRQR